MYKLLKIGIISLVVFVYAVLSNDNQNINDNNEDDEINFDQDDNAFEGMEELLNSDMFKFLENIEDDDIIEGKEQFIGRANENTYCYIRDEDPYHYFSTKTHYPKYNSSSHLDPAPGCEVIYVWMVMRHGIRYGSASKTYEYYHLGELRDQIIKHAGDKKTELCMDDLFNFLLWIPVQLPGQQPVTPETLTENGYQLVKSMGKLLKEKFPHLIPDSYDPKKFRIEFSDEIKVNQSVEAMTEQLFGKKIVPPLDPDGLMEQVYKRHCRRPQTLHRESGKNFTYLTQTSDYVTNMVGDISLKLGFDAPLTYRDIAKMYDGCQYEIAWGHDRSPWCAVFTKDQLKIMEYIGDISYYYFCGPGDVYNYFQGCVILKDLIHKLMAAAQDKNEEEKMSMILGHSTTVLLLITQLGLIDDPTLTHENYFELADRKWRTSLLAPYTGNIMVVLQRCSSGEKHRVKFLLNEKPFVFNNVCDENYLCSLEKVYKLFEPIITSEECSTRYCQHTPEEMCKYLKFNPEDCEILRNQVEKMDQKLQSKIDAKEQSKKIHKVEEEEEEKEKVKPKEYLILENEYKHACILLCVCMIIVIGVFCKMNRVFSRIFRKTQKETKKETGKTKSVKNNKKENEVKKEKSEEKNNLKEKDVKNSKQKKIKDKKEN